MVRLKMLLLGCVVEWQDANTLSKYGAVLK